MHGAMRLSTKTTRPRSLEGWGWAAIPYTSLPETLKKKLMHLPSVALKRDPDKGRIALSRRHQEETRSTRGRKEG